MKSLLKKPRIRRLNRGEQDDSDDAPIRYANAAFPRPMLPLNIQLESCELLIRFHVLIARPTSDFRGKSRRRWLLVPANLFQIIPHVLLIERSCEWPGLYLLAGQKRKNPE